MFATYWFAGEVALAFNFSRWPLGGLFKSKRSGEPVVRQRPSPYHAVSVQAGPRACKEARALADKRYLSDEAPSLPLPTCDARVCTCRYRHHSDRRSGEPRREADIGIVSMEGKWSGLERRRTRGRRREDR